MKTIGKSFGASVLLLLAMLYASNAVTSTGNIESELADRIAQAKQQYDLTSAFIGEASSEDETRALYTEYHLLFSENDTLKEGIVQYRWPDGSLKALKYLDFKSGQMTPSFEITDNEFNYRENIVANPAEAMVSLLSTENKKSGAVSLSKGKPVIDAGFDRFVQLNWSSLIAGEKKTMEFLSPTRLQTISLRLRLNEKKGDSIELYIEPKSFWVRLLVDPIKLYYSASKRQLQRYEGLTNIINEPGENYVAVIRYRYPQDKNQIGQFYLDNFVQNRLLKQEQAKVPAPANNLMNN